MVNQRRSADLNRVSKSESGDHGDAKGLEGVKKCLELLESDNVEEGHEYFSIFSGDYVRLSFVDYLFLLEHAAHPALGALHNVNVISDLEISLGVSNKYVVLVSGLIQVKEYLDALGAT